jgi:hypothetical protein
MNPYDLQQLVADLLKAMGYYPSWISPPGRDGGLDIIAHPIRSGRALHESMFKSSETPLA